MRLSLKVINGELERLGCDAVLARGDGYFYVWGGEAADWLSVRPERLRLDTAAQLASRASADLTSPLQNGGSRLRCAVQSPAR